MKAKLLNIQGSIFKINLVTKLIKGMSIETALLQLKFCKKRVSKYILKTLQSAISNAQNNYKEDIDKLYLSNIITNKSKFVKKSKIRARGKIDKIYKKYSNLTIIIKKINGTKS